MYDAVSAGQSVISPINIAFNLGENQDITAYYGIANMNITAPNVGDIKLEQNLLTTKNDVTGTTAKITSGLLEVKDGLKVGRLTPNTLTLTSPNGSLFLIKVADNGTITATPA